MRLTLATFFLTTTCLSFASAADIATMSKIDAVTVFLDGADVSRILDVAIEAGEHSLILSDLPGDIDPQSLRVEGVGGAGLDISSVDSKLNYGSPDAGNAQRVALEKSIQDLMDERTTLDQVVADADYQKRLLMSLADKQLMPALSTELVKAVDAAALGGLLDLVGAKLSVISKTIHAAQIRQREIDKATQDLQNQIAMVSPEQKTTTRVAINVTAETKATGKLKVSYRIGNAGWRPFYDAKMKTPTKAMGAKLELIRRAEVMQATGESWNDVSLTLSTARPGGATQAPDMFEHELYAGLPEIAPAQVDAAKPAPMAMARNGLEMKKEDFIAQMNDSSAPAELEIKQKQAVMEIAGYQALYTIQGRVSVDNSGTAKKVRIGSETYDASLNAIVVPRIDASAYLTAAFKVAGDGPLLPGNVNLFRDGVFTGQGMLPLLNPTEEAKLGFGVDDLIKVKRAEVKRITGEEGIISSSNVETRAWDIVVKNLHDVKVPVTMIDRVPFSANEDVVVATLSGMTEPSVRDLNKRRGVHAWQFDLEPATEMTLKTGYKVTWPKAVQMGMIID